MISMLCFLTLAQTPPAELVIDPSGPWWAHLLQGILPLLGGLFVWLLKNYGTKLVEHIAKSTGSAFLGEVTRKALVVVLHYYQTEVKHYEKQGSWDLETKRAMKRRAIRHLKMMLDPKQLEEAAGKLGIDNFLSMSVEAAVATSKQMGSGKKLASAAVGGQPPSDPTSESTTTSPDLTNLP